MRDGSPTGSSSDETIVLEETKLGDFQIKVRSGSSTFFVDEPFGVGGLASGPNPYDLLSAAIGACSLMTMRLFATENKWPLEHIRVRVSHHRTGLQGRDVFLKEIQLLGSLSEQQQQKLADISKQCPVQVTIGRGSDVQTVLSSSEPLKDTATTRCEHMRDMHAVVRQTPKT
jgi:putative redox protein